VGDPLSARQGFHNALTRLIAEYNSQLYEASGLMTKFSVDLKFLTFELEKARRMYRKFSFIVIAMIYIIHLTAIVLSGFDKRPSEYGLYEWISLAMDWVSNASNGMLLIVGGRVTPMYKSSI
jgi:hypothetical protein